MDTKKRKELITIPVTGMSCAACANRVEKALSKTEGVDNANVNFAAEKANVSYDPGSVNPRSLIGTIEDAGYGAEVARTELGITGMSCASCVGRVEKALNGVPGVLDTSVNLAAEKATVEYLAGAVETRDLEHAVEDAGYGAVGEEEVESAEDTREVEYRKLRNRFFWASALTLLILIGSLPHMLGVPSPVPMRWLNFGLLALATPVQFWAGWRFYRGAWGAIKYGQADMNTLVVGWSWSGLARRISTAWWRPSRRRSSPGAGRTCTSTPPRSLSRSYCWVDCSKPAPKDVRTRP